MKYRYLPDNEPKVQANDEEWQAQDDPQVLVGGWQFLDEEADADEGDEADRVDDQVDHVDDQPEEEEDTPTPAHTVQQTDVSHEAQHCRRHRPSVVERDFVQKAQKIKETSVAGNI